MRALQLQRDVAGLHSGHGQKCHVAIGERIKFLAAVGKAEQVPFLPAGMERPDLGEEKGPVRGNPGAVEVRRAGAEFVEEILVDASLEVGHRRRPAGSYFDVTASALWRQAVSASDPEKHGYRRAPVGKGDATLYSEGWY